MVAKKKTIILLFVCWMMAACNNQEEEEKGAADIRGTIIEIHSAENKLLVEDKEKSFIWVMLHAAGDIAEYSEGQDVLVWVSGIDTSSPATAQALHIEIVKPES